LEILDVEMGLVHLGAIVLLRLSRVILRLRVEPEHDYDRETEIQQKHHELKSIQNDAQVLKTIFPMGLPCVRYPSRSKLTQRCRDKDYSCGNRPFFSSEPAACEFGNAIVKVNLSDGIKGLCNSVLSC
jgi:hypothetical protein